MNINRRDFLKVGFIGSTVLATGSAFSIFGKENSFSVIKQGFRFLRDTDIEFLLAVAPVILNSNYPGVLGQNSEERLLNALDELMASLGEFSQKQLSQLFDLMSIAPLRYLAGGPFSGWQNSSEQQINDFLLGWKNSIFSLKRMGYASICKLIAMSWYTQPENFVQAGYPGPPKKYPA